MSVKFSQEIPTITFVQPSNAFGQYQSSGIVPSTGYQGMSVDGIMFELIQNGIMRAADCVLSSHNGSRLYIIQNWYTVHNATPRMWGIIRVKLCNKDIKHFAMHGSKENIVSEIEKALNKKLHVLV